MIASTRRAHSSRARCRSTPGMHTWTIQPWPTRSSTVSFTTPINSNSKENLCGKESHSNALARLDDRPFAINSTHARSTYRHASESLTGFAGIRTWHREFEFVETLNAKQWGCQFDGCSIACPLFDLTVDASKRRYHPNRIEDRVDSIYHRLFWCAAPHGLSSTTPWHADKSAGRDYACVSNSYLLSLLCSTIVYTIL